MADRKSLLQERFEILRYTDSVEIKSPNLFIPAHVASHVGSLPFYKIAVSPKADRVATMSHNRVLNVYSLEGEEAFQECSVQVLEEEFAEFCLLEFSASGSFILSTRSSARLDVFDNSGGFCYDIPLEDDPSSVNPMGGVCCMKTFVNKNLDSDDKHFDILYVLQYNGVLSAFKLGRLTRFEKLWSTYLGIGLCGSFEIFPDYNLLVVGAHYNTSGKVKPPGGLCSFRMIDTYPYAEPIRVMGDSSGWFKWSSQFLSSRLFAYICSMSVSSSFNMKLATVSTNGDFFLFDVPSMSLSLSISYISGRRPVQALFTDETELTILFDNGDLVRSQIEDIEEEIHANNAEYTFTSRTALVVPSFRELFILEGDPGSSALHEVANQRTHLAFRLWVYTIWRSFKQLVGMAVGDAASPLQMATHSETLGFVVWHSPTRTLEELLERTLNERNYSRAKELAESFSAAIDINIILKREWTDTSNSGDLTVQHVHDILENIDDQEWVLRACLSCRSTIRDVHIELVLLGLNLFDISDDCKIIILHVARILNVCSDVELFLELRHKSLFEIACCFAQRCLFTELQRLLEQNFCLLSDFVLNIASLIPCSVPPKKYEYLLPSSSWTFKDIEEIGSDYVIQLSEFKNSPESDYVNELNFGETVIKPEKQYLSWVMKKIQEIDNFTLVDFAIELLKISIENGFEQLKIDLVPWEFYRAHGVICGLIDQNFESFMNMTADASVEQLISLNVPELISSSSQIVKFLEWKLNDDSLVKTYIFQILESATRKDVKALQHFRKTYSKYVDTDMIIKCLCNCTLTGEDLLNAVRSLSVYSEFVSAIKIFLDRNVRPTFEKIWNSTKELPFAKGLLMQVACCGQARSAAEWEILRDDLVQLTSCLYAGLISDDMVLDILACELLACEESGYDLSAINTVLTLNKSGSKEPSNNKLGWEQSAEILLRQSNEALQEAVLVNDPNLKKARFLANLAKETSPQAAKDLLKLLDTVDVIQDLGSSIMPANVRVTAPMILLTEVINTGVNYKHGKKCAKLAVLLGIATPVATALSLCSLAAIENNDESYLDKYIHEVISKARDIPVVHDLCMKIINSNYSASNISDIYACALLNCPDDQLFSTMELINQSKIQHSFTDIGPIEPSNDVVLDAMYTKIDRWTEAPELSENVRFALNNSSNFPTTGSEVATLINRHSSTAAICLALTDSNEQSKPWTKNEMLLEYEKALRHFQLEITPNLASALPPRYLISKAFANDENISSIDRVHNYGVDRERLIEDVVYRKETIIGLAMSEDEDMFHDALELSKDFKIDEWEVHFASLENALTSCTIQEAKTILKKRGHLSVLRTNKPEFHRKLRTTVLPFIEGNEHFIGYLSLFSEEESEKKSLSFIKKLLEKKKDIKAKLLFTDCAYTLDLILSMPDKLLILLSTDLRNLPDGANICCSAARILLEGTDLRPAASPTVLYSLLGKDESSLLDIIAVKSLSDEISYLEMNLNMLKEIPNTPADLITVLSNRLKLLSIPSSDSFSLPEFSSTNNSVLSRRRN